MQEGGLRGERIHDCAEVGGKYVEEMELGGLGVLTFDKVDEISNLRFVFTSQVWKGLARSTEALGHACRQ